MKKTYFSFLAIWLLVASAQASALCFWPMDCKAYKTKYPIVLVHGVAGFDSILGVDYFYGVRNSLENRGAKVYSANVPAWNDAYVRGDELVKYLEELKAKTGATKFNLIGHSLGSPTIRYAAGVKPELVASVTSVNGVNFGSDFADVARGLVPYDGVLESFVESALNAMGTVVDSLSGDPQHAQDALASITFMTSEGADEFNAQFPDGMPTSRCGQGPQKVNNIHYFSWGGDQVVTNVLDLLDGFFAITGSVIKGANDGLVERCDQHWGTVLGTTYNINHGDAVNHLFGIHHLFETDPLTLYKNHAVRLKGMGL